MRLTHPGRPQEEQDRLRRHTQEWTGRGAGAGRCVSEDRGGATPGGECWHSFHKTGSQPPDRCKSLANPGAQARHSTSLAIPIPGIGLAFLNTDGRMSPQAQEVLMAASRTKTRRTASRKSRKVVPTRSVQELLLELAYRMHATRPVAILPRATGSVA